MATGGSTSNREQRRRNTAPPHTFEDLLVDLLSHWDDDAEFQVTELQFLVGTDASINRATPFVKTRDDSGLAAYARYQAATKCGSQATKSVIESALVELVAKTWPVMLVADVIFPEDERRVDLFVAMLEHGLQEGWDQSPYLDDLAVIAHRCHLPRGHWTLFLRAAKGVLEGMKPDNPRRRIATQKLLVLDTALGHSRFAKIWPEVDIEAVASEDPEESHPMNNRDRALREGETVSTRPEILSKTIRLPNPKWVPLFP